MLTTAQGCARFSDWRTARPVTDALAVTFDATITPDGRGLLRDQYSVCQIMTLPLAETAPAWLPELDECVYLQSLRGDGIFEALPATAWLALRSCLAALPRQGFVERIRTLVRRRSVGAPADARQRRNSTKDFLEKQHPKICLSNHERDRPGGTLSCACCGRANPKVGQCATAPIVSAQTHCGKLPHNVITLGRSDDTLAGRGDFSHDSTLPAIASGVDADPAAGGGGHLILGRCRPRAKKSAMTKAAPIKKVPASETARWQKEGEAAMKREDYRKAVELSKGDAGRAAGVDSPEGPAGGLDQVGAWAAAMSCGTIFVSAPESG